MAGLVPRPHPRTIGWLGTTALAMGGSNQSLLLMAALILGQGSAAVPLLILGLLLSWAAAPGWTELILMWPNRVGGIAATCAEAFRPYSPVLANLTGVCYWWGWAPTCGLTAIISATAIQEWYLPGVPVPLLASGLVLAFAAVNLCGVRWATRLALPIAAASATLAFLSALIPIASGHVNWQQATTFHLLAPFHGVFGQLTSAMAGLYLIGFGAPTFEAAACHVGETVDPVRNVPRAIFASAAMAALYFVVLPVVWLGALGPAPLAGNLAHALGPTFAPLLGSAARAAAIWLLMLNMFLGSLQHLAGAARTLMQLAEDGLLPRMLALRSRTDAPWVATLLTAGVAILFLLGGDRTWTIAAASFCYLIGIALPSVAVWLLRKDAPGMDRPYRAPRGMITLGLLAAGAWGLATVLGFEQFGMPTVLASMALAYSGSALYALRRWGDRRHAGMSRLWRSLHLKLTGAMLLVLTLDGTGYLLAINSISVSRTALITCLQDIFVAVAVLTITVGLVLPGMIGHAAGEVAQAANRLATGALADLSRATQALGAGDLDAARTTVTISPVVVHSRDELGAMAASFNTMQGEIAQAAAALDVAREDVRRARDELRASNAELARWSTELEQHVQERTAALRHRSEQLEAILAAGQHVRVHQSAAEVLQRVVEAARAVAGAAVVSAYLPTCEDPAQLECVAVAPLEAAAAVPPQIPVALAHACERDSGTTDDVLLVPLAHEGANVTGLLRLVDVPAEFGHEGRDALTILTTTAAIALENIGLLAREHNARAAAEAAVRVRDDFLTAASHDLRTPLTTIQGHADLIQMRLGTGAAIDGSWLGARIGALQQATRRMVATVEEITDVAELQIGRRLDLKVQPVDVGEMVRAAVALVEGSAPRGAAPVVVAASDPVVVEGDGMRLERVLQNVIGNAVKYSPGGTPVQVQLSRQEDWAVITVRDGGVGIPADELPHIFSKYYRASTSIGIKGTGIGLAGAKAIVTQHGGRITLDSTVGQGTTVVISLPCFPHPWSDEGSEEEEVPTQAHMARCMPHDNVGDRRQATGDSRHAQGRPLEGQPATPSGPTRGSF